MPAWLWGGASGLCGVVGLLILYRSLSSGRMSVAAPVSAVIAAIIPVLVGAVVDGLPGVWTFIGFALALAAVWLIARGEGGKNSAIRPIEVYLPLLAGVTFGMFFVFMHQAGSESVLWPVVVSRLTSITSLLVYALVKKQPWRPKRAHWPLVALSGVLDIGGNSFYLFSCIISYIRIDSRKFLGLAVPHNPQAIP